MTDRNPNAALWTFFEKSSDGAREATCNYCTRLFSYRTTITNLKAHLKIKHPYVYENFLAAEAQNQNGALTNNDLGTVDKYEVLESEADDEKDALGDENQFTEVFYVEEPPKQTPKRYITPKSKKKLAILSKTKIKRSNSDISDDTPLKKTNTNPDQLDSFLLYIKSLLSQTPPDLSTKLQMDIVNMIMKAKLSETQKTLNYDLVKNDEKDEVLHTEVIVPNTSTGDIS